MEQAVLHQESLLMNYSSSMFLLVRLQTLQNAIKLRVGSDAKILSSPYYTKVLRKKQKLVKDKKKPKLEAKSTANVASSKELK